MTKKLRYSIYCNLFLLHLYCSLYINLFIEQHPTIDLFIEQHPTIDLFIEQHPTIDLFIEHYILEKRILHWET